MKGIAKFYTLFWILYFPLCIAYYDVGPTNMVDEIMTVILIVYTFTKMNQRYVVKEPKKEYMMFLLALAFFIAYGLTFGVNVHEAVWRDSVQWIRPFSVIYCTWILNPQFSQKQKNLMLFSMVITIFSWLIYHPDIITNAHAEVVILGQLAMCTGMAWYLFKKHTKKNKYIATLIVLSGFLAPKVKFIGEVVCFIYYIHFMTSKPNIRNKKTLGTIIVLVAIVLFFTWDKVDTYYFSGLTSDDRLARPETYKVAWKLLWDYFPFGPGMGSFAVAAAAEYYSPLYYQYNLNTIWGLTPDWPEFLADAFYPTLANIGVIGTCLFIGFWIRRLRAFNQILDLRYFHVAWITFFCIAIEQTADTSFLSGKGMGYCMLIALCLNANRNMLTNRDDTKNMDKNDDEEDTMESEYIYGQKTLRNGIVIKK